MGLGILILLPKQLRELGSIIIFSVFNPGYHGKADTPISSVGPTPIIVLTKKSYLYCQIFLLCLLIINYLNLVTMVTTITWKKVAWKTQVIILSCY